jgi:hypothetical protein
MNIQPGDEVDELEEIEALLCILTLRVTQIRDTRRQNARNESNGENPPFRPYRIGDQVRLHLRGNRYAIGTVTRITAAYLHIRVPEQNALIKRVPHKVVFVPPPQHV